MKESNIKAPPSIRSPSFFEGHQKKTQTGDKLPIVSSFIDNDDKNIKNSKMKYNLFFESPIPLTQSKELSQKLFYSETPIDFIQFNQKPKKLSRPRTSQIKMNISPENFENVVFEESNSNDIQTNQRKLVKKKTSPFQMISHYTKTQNENFLEKVRVLSAISKRSDTLLNFETVPTDNAFNFLESDEEKIHNLQTEESINELFDENQIFGI